MALLTLTTIVGAIFASGSLKVSAIAPTNIPGKPDSIINVDDACQQRLNAYGPNPSRADVDASEQYAPFIWGSIAGNAGEYSWTIPYADRDNPVGLQLNSLLFVCEGLVNGHIVVNNTNWYVNYGNSPPITEAESSTYFAALTSESFYVQSATAADTVNGVAQPTGTVSGIQGATDDDAYNAGSRYWFDTPDQFTYTPPPGGLSPGTHTITINTSGYAMFEYYNSTSDIHCTSNGPALPNTNPSTLAADCPLTTESIAFNITIPAAPAVTVTGRVYDIQTGAGAPSGTTIQDCSSGTHDGFNFEGIQSNGDFTVQVPAGQPYCLRVNGDSEVNGSSVYIRPYDGSANPSGGHTDEYTDECENYNGFRNDVGYGDFCQDQTYRCQIADSDTDVYPNGDPSCQDNNYSGQIYNRGSGDSGYQFVYDTQVPINGNVHLLSSGTGVGGVPIYDCSDGNLTQIGSTANDGPDNLNTGNYTVDFKYGQEFCLNAGGSSDVVSYGGNNYTEYDKPYPESGDNSTYDSNTGCKDSSDNTFYCASDHEYHCQFAGYNGDDTSSACNGINNRNTTGGYRFVILASPSNGTPPQCGSSPGSQTVTGETGTAPSDYGATITATVGNQVLATVKSSRPSTPGAESTFTIKVPLSSLNGLNDRTVDININGKDDSAYNFTYDASQCEEITCPNVTFNGPIDELNTFTISVDFNPYGANGDPSPNNLNPNIQPVPQSGLSVHAVLGSGSSSLQGTEAVYTEQYTEESDSPGQYTITYTATIQGKSRLYTCTNASSTGTNYAEPYLKVYGGDTMSGSGFATEDCVSSTDPGTYAWNNGSTGNATTGAKPYSGASTDQAALSMFSVVQFASNNGQSATGTLIGAPDSLTFANTGNIGSTGYGGNYGNASCVPDYYSELSTSPYASPQTTNPTVSGYPSANGYRNVYLYNGGNVYIDANTGLPAGVDLTGGPSNMPLFYVIVKGGNIYINDSVTRMAGVYIAEPDSSGNYGQIYTCADGSGSVPSSRNLFSDCSSTLSLNGALIAKDIHFLRTKGSVQSALEAKNATCSNGTDPNVAEELCYTPLTWLADPFPTNSDQLNSITSLPPVL